MERSADLSSPAPGLARRLAALAYEGLLLFGVLFGAAFVFSVATNQRHGLHGRSALGAFLFAVLGVYFVWFWSRSGQTLALKTWHLRIVSSQGTLVTPWRALLRYLLAWLWFLPALVSVWLLGLHDPQRIAAALIGGLVGYALLARLHPQRQLPHEILSATRLVTLLPAKP